MVTKFINSKEPLEIRVVLWHFFWVFAVCLFISFKAFVQGFESRLLLIPWHSFNV